MAEFKLVIGDPKSGKSFQREVKDQDAAVFLGKKIKDTIKGEVIGLQGYEFEITGGSDASGFPMRYDVEGVARKRILAIGGVGLKKKDKGIRQRKTVCGNTVHDKITQINLKVLKAGKGALGAPEAPAEGEAPAEAPAEEKAEEKPAEEKKEAPKEEVKAEEPKEEPAEEKKEEAPEEKAEEEKKE